MDEENISLDKLDQLCIALELDENKCFLLKEAFQDYCKVGDRKKRQPSPYNVFMGSCIRERPPGVKVTEAMKQCARKWKEMQKGGA